MAGVNDTDVRGTERKTRLGMPVELFWGYIAIAIFMVGDGMEQAFLSKYIIDLGFSSVDAARLITVYGVGVAISAWLAGVLSDIWGPRRTMTTGLVVWIVFQILFLTVGVRSGNYPAMVVLYGLRGLGYPLFVYSFLARIAYVAPRHRLSAAMGWFWFSYSVGYLAIGNYLPSFAIPALGYIGTLWMEVAWIAVGGLIGIFLVRTKVDAAPEPTTSDSKVRKAVRGVTIAWRVPRVGVAGIVKVINQSGLYGFPVMLPIFLTTKEIGFTVPQWLQIWGTMGVVNLIFNAIWGALGDKIGWARQVRWFGCVGTAIASLLLYYVPEWTGPNFLAMVLTACFFGITMAAFVPLSAIIPSLAPRDEKGIGISIHNLASGLANLIGPAIVGVTLSLAGYQAVVWVFAVIYLIGAGLSFLIGGEHEKHPAVEPQEATPAAS
ncbi:MFS transporter [Amycolatopsis acidiphila]|uniref:MFS transporter n=1 Tax=Amycolatopsis acidiphila TaxID=715473 RepID=A0A558ADV2_9PSEU|nr:MFS transporter [Amycolatopsis acidiphila]TVT22435.1 MFS transporter [Amycolatopsis acidiphila]UIJ57638.1 MFS transporter [Amycolatopsis acidiphila]GHG90000.1 MFS transporter [Amycolatopsis acidiphila]